MNKTVRFRSLRSSEPLREWDRGMETEKWLLVESLQMREVCRKQPQWEEFRQKQKSKGKVPRKETISEKLDTEAQFLLSSR